MIELENIIVSNLDLTNYLPLQKLYTDYEDKLQQALEQYKKDNELEPITEDIMEGNDIILSAEMQKINRDYAIKQELSKDVKIEITEDNLLTYFKQKEKTELEKLRILVKQLSEDLAQTQASLIDIEYSNLTE